MTPEQWRWEFIETRENLSRLALSAAPIAPSILFEWPLRPAPGFEDFGYHAISGFPDLDPSAGLLDHECGQRTYDGHNGTDPVLWPFWWYKMDHDQVEIVAAASGVIINRADGFDDRSCTPGGSSNKVTIRHADGTMAWYLHMKKWSVTPKQIGETVVVGEYLGIVGSSGNSGLPHLHIDFRDQNWNNFDPHEGPCNDTIEGSRWVRQRPYYDSYINALRTHSAEPVFPPCPQQEIPHFQDQFVPTETVFIGIYHRDIVYGQVVDYAVLRPDGTVALQGSYGMDQPHYAAAYALPEYVLPADAPGGTWTVRVDYDGLVYTREFTVDAG